MEWQAHPVLGEAGREAVGGLRKGQAELSLDLTVEKEDSGNDRIKTSGEPTVFQKYSC